MNLEQIIARQEENIPKLDYNWEIESPPKKEVLEWYRSSIKEILEGVKQFIEDNKRLENNPDGYDGLIDTDVINAEDTINYIEEIIKKL